MGGVGVVAGVVVLVATVPVVAGYGSLARAGVAPHPPVPPRRHDRSRLRRDAADGTANHR
ncbi:hypothetical protein [Streptomyces sp. AF1A]|uniref:hypothetical protein n=1 Tax=Streptomyces sp. AF1A TaxID=3394350 RepID=UPI0039BC338C